MHDTGRNMGAGTPSGRDHPRDFFIIVEMLDADFGLLDHGVNRFIPALRYGHVAFDHQFVQIQINFNGRRHPCAHINRQGSKPPLFDAIPKKDMLFGFRVEGPDHCDGRFCVHVTSYVLVSLVY
jgi:hypothetical protein